jgi:prevent-host-death family protein
MVSVGIRELRQNPAAAIAAAKHGEVVTVTERGAGVAQIIPLASDQRDRMAAAGQLRLAQSDYRTIAAPEPVAGAGGTPLSATLANMRESER